MLDELKPGDRVELMFDDFTTRDDVWVEAEEAAKETPATIELVGIYLNHDERVVRVAFGRTMGDEAVCTLAMIPVGCVKSAKKLL